MPGAGTPHQNRSPIGFHPDLELGCDDLEFSWRLRQSGFELLLARDVFVSHACRVSFSRADFETAKKVAEADAAMQRILGEAHGGSVDRINASGGHAPRWLSEAVSSPCFSPGSVWAENGCRAKAREFGEVLANRARLVAWTPSDPIR